MVSSLLGYYSFRDTFIHRLDPRVKILSIMLIGLFLFLLKSYLSFIIVSFFTIIVLIISKIRLKNLLNNIRPFLFFFFFILLMYFLFSRSQFEQGIIVVWRFLLLIMLAAVLTFTTSISELIYAIEKLFIPLRLVGISPRNIALMLSATIRFVPLLFFESSIVMDAQKSRGADLRRPKHVSGLVNALLKKTFNKASNLADAIESRGYRDRDYSHFRELKLCARDYISAIMIIFFVGILLWMGIYRHGS